jgi:hypothetical protein
MYRILPDNASNEPSFSASRRSFIKGARVALGAGAAFGVMAVLDSKDANAWGGRTPFSGGGGAPCFLAGTRIRTASGLVAVEDLRMGDAVLTESGEAKPIKWVGKLEGSYVAPVKISKFAIDGKAPHRDLYVTPRHAIYIDGYLIPAINLVNGITITANSKSDLSTFTYYHIEFETHEVIHAEGLTVESYLAESGVDFSNADEYLALYGPRAHSMAPFAPILSYNGRKNELASYFRSTLACVYDIRTPLDKIRDRIADQAEFAKAA